MKKLILTMLWLSIFSRELHAEEVKTKASPKKEKINVLDFEGEVIEGERKKPDLFLQVSPQEFDFNNLLYQRNNFNDYLEYDKNTRPRYLKKSK